MVYVHVALELPIIGSCENGARDYSLGLSGPSPAFPPPIVCSMPVGNPRPDNAGVGWDSRNLDQT